MSACFDVEFARLQPMPRQARRYRFIIVPQCRHWPAHNRMVGHVCGNLIGMTVPCALAKAVPENKFSGYRSVQKGWISSADKPRHTPP